MEIFSLIVGIIIGYIARIFIKIDFEEIRKQLQKVS